MPVARLGVTHSQMSGSRMGHKSFAGKLIPSALYRTLIAGLVYPAQEPFVTQLSQVQSWWPFRADPGKSLYTPPVYKPIFSAVFSGWLGLTQTQLVSRTEVLNCNV